MSVVTTADELLHFWFDEYGPDYWWKKDAGFDRACRQRCGDAHRRAGAGELADWRDTPAGRLAEIVLLDQLSRNLYRDHWRMFAQDGMALVLAQETVRAGFDCQLDDRQRYMLYMPFMHSESPQVHLQALTLFTALGNADALDYEQRHKAIVDRFGRYPHRNALLGRESTAEELAFLAQPGSSF